MLVSEEVNVSPVQREAPELLDPGFLVVQILTTLRESCAPPAAVRLSRPCGLMGIASVRGWWNAVGTLLDFFSAPASSSPTSIHWFEPTKEGAHAVSSGSSSPRVLLSRALPQPLGLDLWGSGKFS